MKPSYLVVILAACLLFFIFLFSACYTVRITNHVGTGEPDLNNRDSSALRGMLVHEIDTVIKLNLLEGDFDLIERCESGGFYVVEYRVDFGSILLSAITFGRKRKVKLRYVCLLDESEFE